MTGRRNAGKGEQQTAGVEEKKLVSEKKKNAQTGGKKMNEHRR